MELDWLDTFLAVVDSGGFTAASVQVHRSQSRVSAHIAALERDLGVRLIDRTHRPATLTPAGRLFADHSRRILAELGTARAAVGVLRGLDAESLAVLTISYIGTALFPGVIADMVVRYPGARVSLTERGWREPPNGELAADFMMAVLPTRGQRAGAGLHQRPLWRERIRVVVPRDHELAVNGAPVALRKLIQHPLVMTGDGSGSEIPSLLAARGLEVGFMTNVDRSQTLIEMARRGIGVGVDSAVALEHTDTSGVLVLDLDDPEMLREVSVYWHELLTNSEVGAALHRTVLRAPLPRGASAVAN